MIQNSDFKPLWWLSSRHVQTMWPMLAKMTRRRVPLRRERLELPDGDFIELDFTQQSDANSPVVLFLHGLGGSARSPYIQGLLRRLGGKQWQGVVMHYRGCGGQQNRLQQIYHSGETRDLAYVVSVLQKRYGRRPIMAVGFSMGGNVLLKWLGEQGERCPIHSAVAVSVPFELEKIANYLTRSLGGFYEWWFISSLKRTIKAKFRKSASPVDLRNLSACQRMQDFDEQVTAPLHGFVSAMDYYRQSSSRQFLKHITVPTLILHALDDPLMPASSTPTAEELSPTVTMELSATGGHLGFVTSKSGLPKFWLDDRVMRRLEQAPQE